MPQTPFKPKITVNVDQAILALVEKFQSLSMVRSERFMENLMLTQFFSSKVPADVVECGTWKGGMACAMMGVCGDNTQFHFFDSFEGLPDPKPIDGEAAKEENRKKSPKYFANCLADYEEFCNLVYSQGVSKERIRVYKGWFADTLPQFPQDRTISVLRLDGDWYDSTMECLTALYPKVVAGGITIIDDYDAYEGCPRAVHDYLSQTNAMARLHRTPGSQVAYLIKY